VFNGIIGSGCRDACRECDAKCRYITFLSIHRNPPAFVELVPKLSIFETGIKHARNL
jgi:hypothetical protein